jgi:SAM-dependent methyltransferase
MPDAPPDEGQTRHFQEVLAYLEKTSPSLHAYVQQHLNRLIEDTIWVERACDPKDAIVDIGSFPWFVPGYLSLRGFQNILAVDIERKDTFARAPEWHFGVANLDIEEAPQPLANNSIDTVLLFEVFEHIYRRPNFVFRELSRVLKPGGRLVISTPNGARLDSLAKFVKERRLGPPLFDASCAYEELGHFSHLREYSLQELREYLSKVGFSIELYRYRTYHNQTWLERALSKVVPSLGANLFLVCSKQVPGSNSPLSGE